MLWGDDVLEMALPDSCDGRDVRLKILDKFVEGLENRGRYLKCRD
jgi:hypothetical protein